VSANLVVTKYGVSLRKSISQSIGVGVKTSSNGAGVCGVGAKAKSNQIIGTPPLLSASHTYTPSGGAIASPVPVG